MTTEHRKQMLAHLGQQQAPQEKPRCSSCRSFLQPGEGQTYHEANGGSHIAGKCRVCTEHDLAYELYLRVIEANRTAIKIRAAEGPNMRAGHELAIKLKDISILMEATWPIGD